MAKETHGSATVRLTRRRISQNKGAGSTGRRARLRTKKEIAAKTKKDLLSGALDRSGWIFITRPRSDQGRFCLGKVQNRGKGGEPNGSERAKIKMCPLRLYGFR
jgi:hypothetical protein